MSIVAKNKVVSVSYVLRKLAGQTVSFEVTVQGVRDATPEEIRDGRPAGESPTLQ